MIWEVERALAPGRPSLPEEAVDASHESIAALYVCECKIFSARDN